MWGYYVAGGFLLFCAAVVYMFACADKLGRIPPRSEPVPVHPDDWAPDAPLWTEGDHDG